jgi:protein-disulfide isomerase
MRKDAKILAGTALVLVAATVAGGVLYTRSQRQQRQQQQAAIAAAPAAAPADSVYLRPHSHVLGPADAKVTVVEFLDPECETCRLMYPLVKAVMKKYEGRVRLVVRYMPFHPNSLFAASALEAAAEQGKYWEMLEAVFQQQPQWGDHHQPRPELIPEIARQLGLDMDRFNRSLSSPAHKQKVQIDEADGKTLGVNGTPTFFVNGKQLDQLGYDQLQALIDEALSRAGT